jgi:hypothetical protein
MDVISRVLILGVFLLAGVLLFSPYEAWLEGTIALACVFAVIVGFSMHPRREVFYVRTAVRRIDPDRKFKVEKDLLAVRVELTRLWLLFLPTLLAIACLIFLVASGPTKFSFFNWIFSSTYELIAMLVCQYVPLLVLLLLWDWIDERRVMRDAEACSVRSFSISRSNSGRGGRVSYLFMGDGGEYYGGYSFYFGLVHPHELATIVFHNARKPELNKIAMGFLFHRLIVLGRGVTELDMQTEAAQTALAETVVAPAR